MGILSVKDNKLFFASKSTDTGDYVKYFKSIFYNNYDDKQIEKIKEKIIQDDITIVFEVIDNVNDPHIIEYKEPKIILLDMIYNKVNYSKISYDDLQKFTIDNGIQAKELVYTANSFETFKTIYEKVTSKNYKLNDEYIEGFVIEDSDGFMAKIKTSYYNQWKYLRTKMEDAIKNNNYKSKSKDELECNFLKYLQTKYEDKDINIKSINLIDERKEFQNK